MIRFFCNRKTGAIVAINHMAFRGWEAIAGTRILDPHKEWGQLAITRLGYLPDSDLRKDWYAISRVSALTYHGRVYALAVLRWERESIRPESRHEQKDGDTLA